MITCLILWIPVGTTYEPNGPPLARSSPAGKDESGDEGGDDEGGDDDDAVQPASTPQAARVAHTKAFSCRGN